MKMQTISLAYAAEKVEAMKLYMAKKNLQLESELLEAVDKVYEKYVPAQVREFLSDRAKEVEEPPRQPRVSRERKPDSGGSESEE
jgi:hypothetical protein